MNDKFDSAKDKVEAKIKDQANRKPWTLAVLVLVGIIIGAVATAVLMH